MAEVLLSPGVLANENDNSFLQAQPIQAGAAILGPIVKGPVGIPTLVTTYSDYQNRFGAIVESGSVEYTYLTSIAAYNYFQQGGDSLLVTRVVSGSYTSATSSVIPNNKTAVAGLTSTVTFEYGIPGPFNGLQISTPDGPKSFISTSFTGNQPGIGMFYFTGSKAGFIDTVNLRLNGIVVANDEGGNTISISASSAGTAFNGETITSGSLGQIIGGSAPVYATFAGGTDSVSDSAFTLETLSEGTDQNSSGSQGAAGDLTNGTRDNIRWEVVSPNTASGTFSLLIRRGDDITTSKTVLETWSNLSLDPNASNYIEKVIGNSKQIVTSDNGQYYVKNEGTYNTLSRYVRVKDVTYKTLNYFDNAGNAKTEYTASIPVAASGAMGVAEGTPFVTTVGNFYENIGTETQGLVADNYTNSINLLSNQDEYRYNLIVAPGLTKQSHSAPLTTMIDTSQKRGDNLSIIDLRNYNSEINSVINEASSVDSSYAATYWPWVQTIDPDLGSQVWVPASTMMPGVFAFNDRAGEAWFAPAGLSRGGMSTVLRAERKLTNGNRDTLYQANVNPIATFPNSGVVVFGQKTLQTAASALDRVNVRRLLIELKSYISQIADNLVFEQNTIATRNNFLTQVNPYLASVQQRQGLYAFKVVMDDSNNTPDVIDRNQMIGQIYIQPTKTAEFIYLDFNILPTGATFPA